MNRKTDYDALLASFLDRYRPSDEAERDLIREMVNAHWRLRRIEAMETALVQKAIDDQMAELGEGADPGLAQFLAYADVAENSKGLRLLNRYAKDLRRSYEKALGEFLNMHQEDEDESEALAEIAAAMGSLAQSSGSFRQSVPESLPPGFRPPSEQPIALNPCPSV